MEDILACVSCGAILPTDKSVEKRMVRCVYCRCPNPNPNLPTEHRLFEIPTTEDRRKRVIELKLSTFSQLSSQVILWLGTALLIFIFFFFRQASSLIYLYASLIMLLPTIRSSFVNSYWNKTLIRLSSRSQEHYTINYNVEDASYLIIGYIYMFIFAYLILSRIVSNSESEYRYILPGFLALITSYGVVMFAKKTIKFLGELAGKIFSKK